MKLEERREEGILVVLLYTNAVKMINYLLPDAMNMMTISIAIRKM